MKKLLIALGVSAAVVSGTVSAADLTWDATKNAQAGFIQPFSAEIEPGTCSYAFATGSGAILPNINITSKEREQQKTLNEELNGSQVADVVFKFTNCPVVGTNNKRHLTMYVLDNMDFIVKGTTNGLLTNLAVRETPETAAQNANIQLLDESLNPLKFGKVNAIEKPLAEKGTTEITFNFKARVHSPEGKATAGIVTGNAPFVVEYK